jgi:hypothetical protein
MATKIVMRDSRANQDPLLPTPLVDALGPIFTTTPLFKGKHQNTHTHNKKKKEGKKEREKQGYPNDKPSLFLMS